MSLLYGGWDKIDKFQLYQSNPSGNYDGCALSVMVVLPHVRVPATPAQQTQQSTITCQQHLLSGPWRYTSPASSSCHVLLPAAAAAYGQSHSATVAYALLPSSTDHVSSLLLRCFNQHPRWKATAIGANHQSAENILKQDYKDDITLEAAVKLVIKVGRFCPLSRQSLRWPCTCGLPVAAFNCHPVASSRRDCETAALWRLLGCAIHKEARCF